MDPAGYTFILRAVQKTGAAMFGPDWSGDEATVEPVVAKQQEVPPEPSLADEIKYLSEYDRAQVAIDTYLPELTWSAPRPSHQRPPEVPLSKWSPPKHKALPPDRWPAVRQQLLDAMTAERRVVEKSNLDARARAERLNKELRKKWDRFEAVCGDLVRQCEAGRLKAVHRARQGGALFEMRRDHWNTERWIARFIYGAFNLDHPFSENDPGGDARLIFFETAALDQSARNGRSTDTVDCNLPHLSPYVQLMLAVARKAGVTVENQPTKLSIEAEIRALAPADLRVSARLVQAMATLIREPESQLGRAARRPSSRRVPPETAMYSKRKRPGRHP